MAAHLGLPFSFPCFLNTDMWVGAGAMLEYRQTFRASRFAQEPKTSLALELLCAPTDKEAEHLALSRSFDVVARNYGFQGLLPPDEVTKLTLTDEARWVMNHSMKQCIVGSPQRIRQIIHAIAQRYETQEFFILTNCYSFEDRVRSYELLAASLNA
jgi:alkanesulfonate monooxygenase SsuD/methylene tetrahydromethanopterin reductase-like flavin-dependent oxidoreductase (luciferase family)